jgi:uncharacterized protein YjdB
MRDLTTNWNSSAYYDETIFVDRATGATVTIPANKAVDVRSMQDSVQSGAYFNNPTSVTVSDETLSVAVDETDTVTVTLDPVIAGVLITAATDDDEIATVTPASGRTLANGTVVFTIAALAEGEATITFTCGTRTDTVVVTGVP